MANKIISLQTDTKSSIARQEVYSDVSMHAAVMSNRMPIRKPVIIKLLEAEKESTSIKNTAILTEEDLQGICAYYDMTNDINAAYQMWLKKSTYKVGKNTDVTAVKNAIHNIFTWVPGERILNPEFGTNLRKILYEGIVSTNIEKIIAEINHSISKWEPRAEIINIVDMTSTDDKENNTVVIRIIYTVKDIIGSQFTYDYVSNYIGEQ